MILPRGMQLMRPDGTLYDLPLPAHPMFTPDQFQIGILEPDGVLRPFFYRQTMVKVRRHGPGNFEFVPLTFAEFVHYRYNQNIASLNEAAAQYVAEVRERRQRGGGSS